MDLGILFVVAALLLVFWLIRSHFTPYSDTSGGEVNSRKHKQLRRHSRRRISDHTPSGRASQRMLEGRDQSEESTLPLTDAASREVTIDTVSESVRQLVLGGDAPAVSESSEEPHSEPATGAADQTVLSQRSSQDAHSEVNRLTNILQQRERSMARNRHAMEEVKKLKKKLFEQGREVDMLKQACARSDAALTHFRTRAQHAAMFEQQLAEAREGIKNREQELQELRLMLEESRSAQSLSPQDKGSKESSSVHQMDVSKQKNRVGLDQLAEELKVVENMAEQARQNSLELRRIRGELESVSFDQANAQELIAELQLRLNEQRQALEADQGKTKPTAEITVLKDVFEKRLHQNEKH